MAQLEKKAAAAHKAGPARSIILADSSMQVAVAAIKAKAIWERDEATTEDKLQRVKEAILAEEKGTLKHPLLVALQMFTTPEKPPRPSPENIEDE